MNIYGLGHMTEMVIMPLLGKLFSFSQEPNGQRNWILVCSICGEGPSKIG